ncbi:MAG: hypothetical protein WC003_01565 [Terrimicrobiaceae bacterium]
MRPLVFLTVLTLAARADNFNEVVLQQVRAMPQGGGYAATARAHEALASAARMDAGHASIRANRAVPSYCSGATYLVFLKTLGELQRRGSLQIGRGQWEALLPVRLADGEGVWGRWNANGPGTPRLFFELGLGKNFTSFEDARPGDFLKIFWTDAVGKNERGHSVIFLGLEAGEGAGYVRFWSSNKPGGYGEKSVPRSKIARAIFSRLETPANISGMAVLARRDPYLAGLLTNISSFDEAARMCGVEGGMARK